MKATLNITVDGQPLTVPEGISVAAALALTGDPTTRQAVNGELRARFAAWASARSAGSPSTAIGCWPVRPCAGPVCK